MKKREIQVIMIMLDCSSERISDPICYTGMRKINREIPGFFKISRDISRPEIEPGSRELNPSSQAIWAKSLPLRCNSSSAPGGSREVMVGVSESDFLIVNVNCDSKN